MSDVIFANIKKSRRIRGDSLDALMSKSASYCSSMYLVLISSGLTLGLRMFA